MKHYFKIKKLAAAAVIISLCAALLCSCSEKKPEGKEAFTSPSVISGLFEAYNASVRNNILIPSKDAHAESLAEYTYMTDDGEQTAHMSLAADIRAQDGAISVAAGEKEFVYGGVPALDGYTVRRLTDKKSIQKAADVFIKTFCRGTDGGDYDTAPDSIRAAEDDVEVDRVTLRLDKDKYITAFDAALTALKNDGEYLKDVLGTYALLHNREETAEQLLEKVLNAISDAAKNSEGQLVWQRYIKDGRAVAARLKFGDNVIRYICAEAASYTELEFSARIGEKELTLAYEARRTGMSDTYNIRIKNGDEITYFDGTAESAYKSGNVGFELRATKNANVINGLKLDISFDGQKKTTYKGTGSIVKNGDKKTFSFELVFSDTETAAIPEPQKGEISPYEAIKEAF